MKSNSGYLKIIIGDSNHDGAHHRTVSLAKVLIDLTISNASKKTDIKIDEFRKRLHYLPPGQARCQSTQLPNPTQPGQWGSTHPGACFHPSGACMGDFARAYAPAAAGNSPEHGPPRGGPEFRPTKWQLSCAWGGLAYRGICRGLCIRTGAECVGSAQRIDFFGGQIDIVDLSSI